jgi:hypothetical protein
MPTLKITHITAQNLSAASKEYKGDINAIHDKIKAEELCSITSITLDLQNLNRENLNSYITTLPLIQNKLGTKLTTSTIYKIQQNADSWSRTCGNPSELRGFIAKLLEAHTQINGSQLTLNTAQKQAIDNAIIGMITAEPIDATDNEDRRYVLIKKDFIQALIKMMSVEVKNIIPAYSPPKELSIYKTKITRIIIISLPIIISIFLIACNLLEPKQTVEKLTPTYTNTKRYTLAFIPAFISLIYGAGYIYLLTQTAKANNEFVDTLNELHPSNEQTLITNFFDGRPEERLLHPYGDDSDTDDEHQKTRRSMSCDNQF